MLTFYCRQFIQPDAITLVLFGEEQDWLLELAAAYGEVVHRDAEARIDLVVYRVPAGAEKRAAPEPSEEQKSEKEEQEFVWRRCSEMGPREDSLFVTAVGRKPEREIMRRTWVKDLSTMPARAIGIGMRIRAAAAMPRFAPEAGLHLLKTGKQGQPARILVEATESELEAYRPPEGITRRGALGSQERRRTYDRTQEVIEDLLLQRRLVWQERALAGVLAAAIDERLQRNLLALLEE